MTLGWGFVATAEPLRSPLEPWRKIRKRYKMRCLVWVVVVALITGVAAAASPASVIAHSAELDSDFNRIADTLDDSLAVLTAEGKLENPVRVIVTLYSVPTREDTDAFKRLGGKVSFVYRHAVFGFAGSIPGSYLPDLAVSLGGKLCIIELDQMAKLTLDDSARHIRARPLVWNVENGYGLNGDPGIIIGITDSGIDDTHPDLAGKTVFWHDFSNTDLPSPDDHVGHGTMASSIAAGTGQAIGSGPITELTLVGGWEFFTPIGYLEHSPLKIPCLGSGEVTMDLVWTGTGTACMDLSDPDFNMLGYVSGSVPPLVHTWSINQTGIHNACVGRESGFVPDNYHVFLATIPYESVGDGYNLFQGIAAECRLAGAKITQGSTNYVWTSYGIAALDSFSVVNEQYDIKVTNCSWIFTPNLGVRAAATGLATAGTVVTCAAGNDFPDDYSGDPALAPEVISVGAINDFGAMTRYSSMGPPGSNKPDVVAPGGSYSNTENVGTCLEAADTNHDDSWGEQPVIPDRQPNDYLTSHFGTSYSAPHVAGLAALVIEALEQTGLVWGYTLDEVLLVKSIILMTATETNKPREMGLGGDPTLDRGGKDRVEGYGKVNTDAAVEAVLNLWGDRSDTSTTITFGEDPFDRKCWATKLELQADSVYDFRLYTNPNLDADLYVYFPDFGDGDPDIVVSSAGIEEGISEFVTGFTGAGSACYLVAKHVSGDGDALLVMGDAPTLALSASLGTDELDLTWDECPWASQFRIYGVEDEPYFDPTPFNQLAVVTPDITTWSSANGIGDPESNWTYMIVAADAADQEIMRSNYCGEEDFELDDGS
jgi:subtilisin family serine protease